MLYVFQVDTGTMMTFEMRLVMDTVASLKRAIAMKTDIPEDKQVLLISGGESLNNTQKVCSYSSAGTDTSPIFLFAKINIESQQPPVLNVDIEDDTDMMEMIESCMSMQPSLDTLVARTELAADLNEQASRQKETCERLVHDQHLQQQGWAAVTANLDDLTRAFKNKSEMLLLAFQEFTKCRGKHEGLLKVFGEDIQKLEAVPILPTLYEGNKLLNPSSSNCSGDSAKSLPSTSANNNTNINTNISNKEKPQRQSANQLAGKQSANSTKREQTEAKTTKSREPSERVVVEVKGREEGEKLTEEDFSDKDDKSRRSSQQDDDNTGANTTADDADSTTTTNDDDTKQSEDEFLDANQEADKLITETAPTTTEPPETATTTTTSSTATTISKTSAVVDATTATATTRSSEKLPPAAGTFDEAQTITLRQWIDFHDDHNSLDRLIELCWRGLERFTEANAAQIQHEVQELLKATNNDSMKEIKGLEERLYGLEKLMVDAKKVVDEQCQLAASFQNNRERFSKIKDSTLLPDLSASHKEQLQMMLANHKKMNDYRNRCVKAKYELSVNLHARLKWIMYIEQQISDLDGKLMIYKENLTRLNRHFDIVEQVHKAPNLYLAACVEALRRRRFSRRYLHWANSIAKISHELFEQEMVTRKEFDQTLGTHFLSSLFPGLTRSYPPPFATKQPDPFDTKLPRITAADIQFLQANLSNELAENLYIPKDVPMPHIISAPNNLDDSTLADGAADDDDARHSLNPTPPSSPTRQQQQQQQQQQKRQQPNDD